MSELLEERQLVEEALQCVRVNSAGHWPTVAGFLAAEVERLRAELARRDEQITELRRVEALEHDPPVWHPITDSNPTPLPPTCGTCGDPLAWVMSPGRSLPSGRWIHSDTNRGNDHAAVIAIAAPDEAGES